MIYTFLIEEDGDGERKEMNSIGKFMFNLNYFEWLPIRHNTVEFEGLYVLTNINGDTYVLSSLIYCVGDNLKKIVIFQDKNCPSCHLLINSTL